MGKQDPSITFEAARAAWLADTRFRRLSPVTIREYGRVSGALLGQFTATAMATLAQALYDLEAYCGR